MVVEYLIVTLIVCSLLVFHYFIFGVKIEKEKKKERERREQFYGFMKKEINSIEKLELAGLGTDELEDELYITESQAIYGIESSKISKLRITLKND